MYGPRTLETVAEHSKEIAAALSASMHVAVQVVFKPALTTPEHLRDFAEMAGIEFLLINEDTHIDEFKKELRWNDLYYQLNHV